MTPTIQHKTEIITLAIITLLYVLNTCLAEIVGNIINDDAGENVQRLFSNQRLLQAAALWLAPEEYNVL